jgi:hypothetical protein
MLKFDSHLLGERARAAGDGDDLLGGVAEFTPADDLSQEKPRASSGAE